MYGIYIHIPFCERKCFYCDFYSIDNLSFIDDYVFSLEKEIHLKSINYPDRKIDTIYIGGGTPSTLSNDKIERILKAIDKNFIKNSDVEITIECNPNSLNKEKLSFYKQAGINRISLGVQSFIDKDLKFLQRLHNLKEARESIENTINTVFNNFNIDLIYAIPNTSISDIEYNLYEILKYNPPHISAYSLIYEEGTPLYDDFISNKIEKINENLESEMYSFIISYLESSGYLHYEVSNYSLKGFESKHNSKYWQHKEYLGFGPAAHSFVNNERLWNYSDLKKYVFSLKNNTLPIENYEILTDKMYFEEMIFLGLRSFGINIKKINEKFNIDFLKEKENIIANLMENNFIRIDNDHIYLTKKGFLLCDEICLKLI